MRDASVEQRHRLSFARTEELLVLRQDLWRHRTGHAALALVVEILPPRLGLLDLFLDVRGVLLELLLLPYGSPENINDAGLRLVQQAGFSSCFSCHGGIINPSDNVFDLSRMPISSWNLSEYHLGGQIIRNFLAA